jgi:hypothetical protein
VIRPEWIFRKSAVRDDLHNLAAVYKHDHERRDLVAWRCGERNPPLPVLVI